MKKKVSFAFGKKVYLLGKDKKGKFYWLEEPSWDCGWYWGFGYVETYTNNKNPHLAKDCASHSHFDRLFLNNNINAFDSFKDFFVETPLSDSEIWMLCDYMRTFYTLKGNLTSKENEDLINKKLLPELFEKIKIILKEEY